MALAYKETRRLSGSALRSVCVRQNWYTKGDNDQYGHLLLDLADHKDDLTTADIIAIAEDIAAHSDLEDDWTIENIAFVVNRACTVTFTQTEAKAQSVPRYLDGPWSNDSCKGYAIMAMRRAGLDEETVKKVTAQMTLCLDEVTVDEAGSYYRHGEAY